MLNRIESSKEEKRTLIHTLALSCRYRRPPLAKLMKYPNTQTFNENVPFQREQFIVRAKKIFVSITFGQKHELHPEKIHIFFN